MLYLLNSVAYAEGEAAAASAEAVNPVGQFLPIIWLVVMVLFFWLVIIRPQKKQEKKQREMLAALQVGDKIVSVGGICGKISKIKDNYVILETGSTGNPNEKSFIKLERSAIKTVETIHE